VLTSFIYALFLKSPIGLEVPSSHINSINANLKAMTKEIQLVLFLSYCFAGSQRAEKNAL
jgi:hypothetical protein